ncbi:alpha/beta hydrolase fold domain-containing protein [Niabella aquatica]
MRLFFNFLLCGTTLFWGSYLKAQSSTDYKNLAYKITANDSLMLDIFLPQNTVSKVPVVVIIHGGAWVEGSRELESIYYMRRLKDQLIKNGIAAISVDYTLVNKSKHFPVPIADCKDAIRWIKANAANYNLDTTRIGLWGGSAGAHLALLAAYTPDSMWPGSKELSRYSASVNYVVDNFGPTDLNQLLQTNASKFKLFLARIFVKKLLPIREQLIFAMTGTSIDTEKRKVITTLAPYAPLAYIQSMNRIPTIIFHGTKDKVVPLKQSKQLHKQLNSANVSNKLIIVKKGDHGFNNISTVSIDALVEQVIEYIQSQNRQ